MCRCASLHYIGEYVFASPPYSPLLPLHSSLGLCTVPFSLPHLTLSLVQDVWQIFEHSDVPTSPTDGQLRDTAQHMIALQQRLEDGSIRFPVMSRWLGVWLCHNALGGQANVELMKVLCRKVPLRFNDMRN